MSLEGILLLTNLSATWFMTGLIWFVQVVHYPQFAGIGAGTFAAYHRRHMRLTTSVVAPPMLIEAATGIALLAWVPATVPSWMLWLGAALLVVIWISTAAVQVPQHNRLATAFNESSCRALCIGNWIRTAAWTARAALITVAVAIFSISH